MYCTTDRRVGRYHVYYFVKRASPLCVSIIVHSYAFNIVSVDSVSSVTDGLGLAPSGGFSKITDSLVIVLGGSLWTAAGPALIRCCIPAFERGRRGGMQA